MDYVFISDGSGLPILISDSSTLHTFSHPLHIKNILCALKIFKNLLSVSKFMRDNTCYFEFHPNYFIVKDLHTNQELLWGSIKDGLYCFYPSSRCSPDPQALLSISTSSILWHQHLGHPVFFIVERTLNSRVSLNKDHASHICSACQMGKIINCSFPITMNKNTELFKLVHTDI